MKILFCLPESYNGNHWGGVSTYTLLTGRELAKMGHDISIVTPSDRFCVETVDRIRIFHLSTIFDRSLIFRIIDTFFSHISWRLRWMLSVYFFWKKFGPYDIVEYPEWGSSGLLIRLFSQQKCVCVTHRSSYQYWKDNKIRIGFQGKIIDVFEQASILTAHLLISPSQFMLRSYPLIMLIRRFFSLTSTVLQYGLNVPKRKTNTTKYKRKYILYVGRLEYGKGCDLLVEAYTEFCKEFPNIKLILIGEDTTIMDHGRELSFMNLLIQMSKKYSKKLLFLGKLSQKKIAKYYASCLFVVAPSRGNENTPFSVLDAIRFAKAVITTDTGGISEIISHKKNGLLILPNSLNTLSTSMILLARDNTLRRQLESFNKKHRLTIDIAYKARQRLMLYGSI